MGTRLSCAGCRVQPAAVSPKLCLMVSAATSQVLIATRACAGSLPADWATAGAFSDLQYLLLGANTLSGEIVESWGGQSGSFPNLRLLDLHDNQFGGTLPSSWGIGMAVSLLPCCEPCSCLTRDRPR